MSLLFYWIFGNWPYRVMARIRLPLWYISRFWVSSTTTDVVLVLAPHVCNKCLTRVGKLSIKEAVMIIVRALPLFIVLQGRKNQKAGDLISSSCTIKKYALHPEQQENILKSKIAFLPYLCRMVKVLDGLRFGYLYTFRLVSKLDKDFSWLMKFKIGFEVV